MSKKRFAVNIDLMLNELLNAVIQNLPSDPATPKKGQFWYNSTTNILKFYDGTSTQTLATGGNVAEAVTRATAAGQAGELLVSAGPDRTSKTYDGGAGLLKSNASGVVSAATPGTDYLTDTSTNTLTNKTINADNNAISNLEVDNFKASALASNVDTGTSSQLVTADKIKTYVDNKVASLGQLVGSHDASGGLLPTTGSGISGAIQKGDYWRILVAGTITGLVGESTLEVGDVLVASIDNADEASEFFSMQGNLTNAITSNVASPPTSNNKVAIFDGTSGKVVKESIIEIDGSNVNLPTTVRFKNASTHADLFSKVVETETVLVATGDWTGATAPFSFTLSGYEEPTVTVYDQADNTQVEIAVGVSGAAITLQTNIKFDAIVVIHSKLVASNLLRD